MNWRKCLSLLLMLLSLLPLRAKDDETLARLFAWTDSVRRSTTLPDTLRAQRHMQYDILLPRRNVLLATVPHMHPFLRSERRQFHGEMFSSVTATERGPISSFELLHLTNLPRRRLPLVPVQAYLTPHPFATTIVGAHLLSPLHAANRRFYRYSIAADSAGCTRVRFRPRVRNTQTVSGEAAVVDSTGRVLWCRFEGEYDHVQFSLRATMDSTSHAPLYPTDAQVDARFAFLGNKVQATLTTTDDTTSVSAIDSLRVAAQIQQGSSSADSRRSSRRRIGRTAENVWDAIHENMLRRIRSDFGTEERAHVSVGPLFNPLYFGYSKSRGITYRLNADFTARLSRQCDLFLGLSGGYSFKLGEAYCNTPLRFTFSRRRNAFVQATVGAGNRITDSGVADKLKALPKTDSVRFDEMQLTYFRNLSLRVEAGCNLTPDLSLKLGGVFHRRAALRRQAFRDVNLPAVYRTFAPAAEIITRPWGQRGPQFQADVEHGMRVMHAASGYERVEINALHAFSLPCTRTLNLWMGGGFYAAKRGATYFLDYANFRRNNLSGGWRDEQTGEFELLNAHWYNASPYYVRLNATYESPLLALSFVPWVGRYVERERLQLSVLSVERLKPYVECGYGMRTRLFSASVYASFSHRGYEDVGLKFGFELFENW